MTGDTATVFWFAFIVGTMVTVLAMTAVVWAWDVAQVRRRDRQLIERARQNKTST